MDAEPADRGQSPSIESDAAVDSDEAQASPSQASPLALPRPGRIRPRRTVFQRLSQASPNRLGRWKVGDRVLVRDKDDKERDKAPTRPSQEDWNPGIVTSLNPVKVRLKGGKESFTWRDVKELPKSRSASPSPCSSTWSSNFLPGSKEVLRRARKLSRRRRKREKEAERKELELWARAQRIQCAKLRNAGTLPNAAQQKKQEQVRKLRTALETILAEVDEVEIIKEERQAGLRALSPGRAEVTQPMGPGVSALKVLKLSKALQGKGFRLKHLELLTVKDRLDVLKKLSHPRPEQAVQEAVFSGWMKQQLQNFRMHNSCGQLPQAASSSTGAIALLNLLRACIERAAPNEDDHQSLQRFVKVLKDEKLRLEHLDRLPQAELKQLVEKLGIKVTGMKKEEVIEKLKTELWSRRSKSSRNQVPNADDLCRYEPAEAIATVRRLLKKAEEEKETKSMTVWELHLWLAQYNANVKDLSCLLPKELRQLTSWLKMPPLRPTAINGYKTCQLTVEEIIHESKDDILEWLQREVWREQMVRRAPSKSSRFLKLSSKLPRDQRPLNPCEVCEDDELDGMLLVDLSREVTMEYDMFVPP